jgi:hypothetical protein
MAAVAVAALTLFSCVKEFSGQEEFASEARMLTVE